MGVNRHRHVLLEQALHAAFAQEPVPVLALPRRTSFEFSVQEYLAGKRWPEAVGLGLVWGERDPSLSGWVLALPVEVMRYYLPSHLMLASLRLAMENEANYCWMVTEAFVLPPPDRDDLAAIDADLSMEALVRECGASRVRLYQAMTPAERACVGRYLDLYAAQHPGEFTGRGPALYAANRDYWLNSSFPGA